MTAPSSETDVVNPLAELCRVLGLTPKHAAAIANVPPSVMRAALTAPAPPVLDAYLRLCAGIGANVRLAVARPFELAFDVARLDALYADAGFRHAQRLPAPDAWTRHGIRRLVVHLRARLDKSYGEIEDHLQQGHVCTTEGLRAWRRSTAQQHFKNRRRRFPDDDDPVVPDADARDAWRRWLVQRIAAAAYPTDPMVFMRYEMLPADVRGDELVLRPRTKVPAVVHRWLSDGLTVVPWLEGAWCLRHVVPAPAQLGVHDGDLRPVAQQPA